MSDFYDELAPLYHLIYEDWDASIERQGKDLAAIIRTQWPAHRTVLDVSCGIGTQAIALAKNDFVVRGSDASHRAIERAIAEARKRGEAIDFTVCDMREVHSRHGDGFDLVVSCDNSVPHLLTDADISTAFGQMFACLRPGGGCIVSARDYDREPRGANIVKPYGVRVENGKRFLLFQVWDFDDTCYDLAFFFVEEDLSTGAVAARVMRSRLYAIGTGKLLALMRQTGFESVTRLDDIFYQPVLIGTKPL